MTLRDEINYYYQQRELKSPNDVEALLWFLSEVGELAEAYLEQHQFLKEIDNDVIRAIKQQIEVGQAAEAAVVGLSKGWTRNNERAVTRADIGSEVADCCMMLEKFAKAHGMVEPADLLRAKMERKLKRGDSLV